MDDTRGQKVQARLDALGMSKLEFAERVGIDRSTLDRVLNDDEKVRERTWARVENSLSEMEEDLSSAQGGRMITSTIEFRGAKVTMQGSSAEVAEAIRRVLDAD